MPKILILSGSERGQVFSATPSEDNPEYWHVNVGGTRGDIHTSRVMVVRDEAETDTDIDMGIAMRTEARRDADLQRRLKEFSGRTDHEILHEVAVAVLNYNIALDNREHGGIAAGRCIDTISDLLDMRWGNSSKDTGIPRVLPERFSKWKKA